MKYQQPFNMPNRDLMILLFSECRTLPLGFGVATKMNVVSSILLFNIITMTLLQRLFSNTDVRCIFQSRFLTFIYLTWFYLPLWLHLIFFCYWHATLQPPGFFPSDAKLIHSLRTMKSSNFALRGTITPSDLCLAASFSIFRSAGILTQLREASVINLYKISPLPYMLLCFLHRTFHNLKLLVYLFTISFQ